MKFLRLLNRLLAQSSSKRFITFLRRKGVTIGEGCEFYGLPDIVIDTTRPSLIEIGNNVIFTKGVILLTHGYDWAVLREYYGEVFGYAQPIKIKNNVFLGIRSIIMPGVIINENCIIATGSIVTKSTEPNSVYAGTPARKIMSIEEYYNKRKRAQIEEAGVYAKSIISNLHRKPVVSDFREFFHLFLPRNPSQFGGIPVKLQTKNHYNNFMISKPEFNDFEDFLNNVCGDELKSIS